MGSRGDGCGENLNAPYTQPRARSVRFELWRPHWPAYVSVTEQRGQEQKVGIALLITAPANSIVKTVQHANSAVVARAKICKSSGECAYCESAKDGGVIIVQWAAVPLEQPDYAWKPGTPATTKMAGTVDATVVDLVKKPIVSAVVVGELLLGSRTAPGSAVSVIPPAPSSATPRADPRPISRPANGPRGTRNDVAVTDENSVTVGLICLGGSLVFLVVREATVPIMVGTGGERYTPIVWRAVKPGSEKRITY